MSTSSIIIQLQTAKTEVATAQSRVIEAIRHGKPVDSEDIVVIRGSSELFAGLAELAAEEVSQ